MLHCYVHVPFCRSRCIYCDFFSTTREELTAAYTTALCAEIEARRRERVGTDGDDGREACNLTATTLYLGGGTPSLLTARQRDAIVGSVAANYTLSADAELTLEANPDDIAHCGTLRPFNRVSLGVQTFDDTLLRFLRRRHDAATAIASVGRLRRDGIHNISIDLIYGLPGQTMATWQHDLDTAFHLGVQHLSAYALSYEQGTPLGRLRAAGQLREVADETVAAMYDVLCCRARSEGYDHYEISNFALPGYASRHNSSYWTGEPYLGFGPGAHSFDGHRTRRANRCDLDAYIRAWATPATPHADTADTERLTDDELYDEAVMCGLRTAVGVNLDAIEARWGSARRSYLMHMARRHLDAGRLLLDGATLRLSRAAIIVSDDVMSDLMADK
ncbi:MAG: radical SAM family heme chaperone HemW [Bacteroidaceae bacterium]|nr:radical SAM family heme chaperone HemW [Bacteroidaceae bacterium]